MAGQVIGIVKSSQGVVDVRAPDGKIRSLLVGDALHEGETVLTTGGGRVVIALSEGGELTLGPGKVVAMTDELSADRFPGADESQVASVDSILAALQEGKDLSTMLEATAAGAGGPGADEGHTFVQLLRVVENVGEVGSVTTAGFEGRAPDLDPIYLIPEEGNRPPNVVIGPGDTDDEADEAGLPEGTGNDPSSVNAGGQFQVSDPDGLEDIETITIGYTDPQGQPASITIPIGELQGTVIQTNAGQLTVTSYDPTTGIAVYEYVLTHPTTDGPGPETDDFTVTVSDGEQSSGPAVISIEIIDDVPVANPDTNTVAGGSANGNVSPNDVLGADGGSIVGVATGSNTGTPVTGNIGSQIAGTYGTLTLNADGSYSYTLNPGNPVIGALDDGESVVDNFVYTVRDGDGDTSTTTLKITINGSNDVPTITTDSGNPQGANDAVLESGLATGSNPNVGDTQATGTFKLSDGDGLDDIKTVTINGQEIAIGSLLGSEVAGTNGTLKITGYNAATGEGTYTYTLTSPTTDGDGTETDTFTLTTSDGTGSSAPAQIVVEIIDDVPTARDDVDSVTEDGALVADGNVVTGSGGSDANATDGVADTAGADGVGSVVWTDAVEDQGQTMVIGQHGILFVQADGSYRYELNNADPTVQALGPNDSLSEQFTYTLTDGDGDAKTATLTIAINGANDGVTVTGIGNAAGDETVFENDLPGGSSPDAAALTQTGSFAITALDGIASVKVGDTTVSFAQLSALGTTPVTIDTPYGSLTLTGYTGNAQGGTVSYSYTLDTAVDNDSQAGATDTGFVESLPVTVTDSDGSVGNSSLNIAINDDVPDAIDDVDSVAAGSFEPATGNVITDAEGDGGADTRGADGATVTAVSGFGSASELDGVFTVNGQYGVLTMNPDGSYSYQRGPNTPGGVEDVFTYMLSDGDGDYDTATLTISIGNSVPTISGLNPQGNGGDVIVDEDDLPAGSDTSKESLTQGGTFTIASPDGVASLTIGGQVFITDGVFTGGSIVTPLGNTLTVTGYDADTGVVSYTYTLNANETHANGNGQNGLFENLDVVLTDPDGQAANDVLSVQIVDDVPDAVNDTDSIAAGSFGPATGNVITDAEGDGGADVRGADGASVTAVTGAGSVSELNGVFTVNGQYGVLTLNADGSYSYTRNANTPGGVNDVFTYTLTDGDGDSDTATLTISIGNATPTITDLTPQANGGDVSVDEDDLPAGSDTSKESLTQPGTFTITSPDGVGSLTIAGQAFITDGVFTGGSVLTPLGNTLTVTGYNPATGVVSYTYTLNANETHTSGNGQNNLFENLGVVLTDSDGQAANGTLSVRIVDDVPDAVNDVDSIAAGSFGPATGNVITDAEGDGGADVRGADGASVTAVTGAGSVSELNGVFTVNGQYGVLTLNADGSYSYTRNANSPGGVNDVFTYTLTDGDGDSDSATLTISIGNAVPTISGLNPQGNGGDVIVDEDDLPAGSDTSKESLTQAGTFTIASPDGVASLTIGGQAFITDGVFTAGSIATGLGNTLTITGYNPATGVVSYTYTLNGAETHANGNGQNGLFENFNVVLTDPDGQAANDVLSVQIVDDVPDAVNDTDSIAAGSFGPATGNVITDAEGDGGADVRGADGANVSAVTGFGSTSHLNGVFTVNGQYGVLTLNADGSYSYTRNANTPGGVNDVFTYTLTDGDGDSDTATLTISIGNATPTITNLTPEGSGGDVTVDEDDLAEGNDPTKESLTQPGTFNISSPDGVGSLMIAGHAFITNGVFTAGSVVTPMGNTLTVTAYDAVTGLVSYTYTLNDNEAHANANGENSLFDNLPVVLTDADGQSVNAVLSARIVDDVPVLDLTNGIAVNAAGTTLVGSIADIGADTNGAALSFNGTQTPPANLTSGGQPVTYGVAGNVLTASAGGQTVFTLTLNPDGTYTYDQVRPLDLFTLDSLFQAGVDAGGPQPAYYSFSDSSFGSNPAGKEWTVRFSSAGNVNPSTPGMGVGNNHLDTGESIRIDVDDDAASGARDLASILTVGVADLGAGESLNFSYKVADANGNTLKDGANNDVVFNGTITSADLVNGTYVFNAPAGYYIDYVDLTGGANTDVRITSVNAGFVNDNVTRTLNFNVTATDGDGDAVTTPLSILLQNQNTVTGTGGNDALAGSDAASTLSGGAGNDILTGGGGNDLLTGGAGSDTFVWRLADKGAAGTPAVDTVTDFGTGGTDVLDLRDLLQGENKADLSNLDNYLHFTSAGGNTTVHISSGGGFAGGFSAGATDQQIVLTGVTLAGGDDQAIIQNLLNQGKLITD